MDSMVDWMDKHYGEKNAVFWDPIDAYRVYFTEDSFALFVLDNTWERILWMSCKVPRSLGFSITRVKRFGGTINATGTFQLPLRIEGDPFYNIYVADTNRIVHLKFERFDDTIKIMNTFAGPYQGIYLSKVRDISISTSWILSGIIAARSVLWILDKGNNRYVKLNISTDSPMFIRALPLSIISGEEIVAIEGVDSVYGPLWAPKFKSYVYLIGNDKIYLLEENDTSGGYVNLLSVLYFPNAKFSAADYGYGNALYVVDSSKNMILCLSKDLSRSYFAYYDVNALSENVYNIAVDRDEVITFAPFLGSTGMDFFKIDLSNIPNDNPLNLSASTYEDKIILEWNEYTDIKSGFQEYIIQKKEENGVWEKVGSIPVTFTPQRISWTDYNVQYGKSYYYRVYGYKTDYYSKPAEIGPISPPLLSPPTNLTASFEDTIVRLTWEDNSLKNKSYFVGKISYGANRFTGVEDTAMYYFGDQFPGDMEEYIDRIRTGGKTIYWVAAIDSSYYYWFSIFDTMYIQILL